MIPVIDLSSHNEDDQNQIDWVAASKYLLAWDPNVIVIVKLSQGDWYASPFAQRQRMGAHAHGIRWVKLYHYAELVSQQSGKALSGADNFAWFARCLGNAGGILPNEGLAFDLEDTNAPAGSDLVAFTLDYCDSARRALNLLNDVYTGDWYAGPHGLLVEPSPLDTYPKWWCIPGDSQGTPPTAPANVKMIQYKFDAVIPGIPYAVDLSWYLGTVDELRLNTWGNQPDPVAGKPATGQPDVDSGADAPTCIKASLAALRRDPPDVSTAIADNALALIKFGLVGS